MIAFEGATGEELWRYTLDTATGFSTVIANGLLFASTENKTLAFDLITHEIVWDYPIGGFMSIAQNRLFITTTKGYVYVFGRVTTDIADGNSGNLPEGYVLYQNYPNPFNPSTTISFEIPIKTDVKLSVYNILGQKVTALIDKQLPAGLHNITWNSQAFPSGTYLYKLSTPEYTLSQKMLLLK